MQLRMTSKTEFEPFDHMGGYVTLGGRSVIFQVLFTDPAGGGNWVRLRDAEFKKVPECRTVWVGKCKMRAIPTVDHWLKGEPPMAYYLET